MKRPVETSPWVGIVMGSGSGSGSDWPTMQAAARVRENFNLSCAALAAIGSKGPLRKMA